VKVLPAMVLLLVATCTASARTITLTADDCDQLAIISEAQPNLSWVPAQMGPGIYETWVQVHLFPNMSALLRFPLDKIPKGQRITKAEFSFPVGYIASTKEVHLRRMVAEWGTGVCHNYRMVFPKKLEWAKPGGRGITSDRANKTSAVLKLEKLGVYTADMTEDVELWYTGAVPNRGFVVSIEDGAIYMSSFYPNGAEWKLQITYEPQ